MLLTKQLFVKFARVLCFQFRGQSYALQPKRFRKGSLGWRHTGEIVEVLDGQPVRVLISIQATVRGSAKWPEEEPAVDLTWAEAQP